MPPEIPFASSLPSETIELPLYKHANTETMLYEDYVSEEPKEATYGYNRSRNR